MVLLTSLIGSNSKTLAATFNNQVILLIAFTPSSTDLTIDNVNIPASSCITMMSGTGTASCNAIPAASVGISGFLVNLGSIQGQVRVEPYKGTESFIESLEKPLDKAFTNYCFYPRQELVL